MRSERSSALRNEYKSSARSKKMFISTPTFDHHHLMAEYLAFLPRGLGIYYSDGGDNAAFVVGRTTVNGWGSDSLSGTVGPPVKESCCGRHRDGAREESDGRVGVQPSCQLPWQCLPIYSVGHQRKNFEDRCCLAESWQAFMSMPNHVDL